jgi:hypothetical protein
MSHNHVNYNDITRLCDTTMLTSGVAKKFWTEAFLAAVQVYNLSPRLSGIETPHMLFFGEKPDVRSLWMFGCEVYCRKTPLLVVLTKLGERSERGLLLCSEQGTKGWRVLLESGDVVVRRNCLMRRTECGAARFV